MSTFEVYFHGLMCFFADQPRQGNRIAPKTQVLFVRDDDHCRSLITPDGLMHCLGFNSMTMTVDNETPFGVIKTSDGFQNDVPHLSDDTHSRRGIFVDPSLAIPLVLPQVSGTLDVAQRYIHAANYLLGPFNTKKPTARITVLTFEAKT